MPPPAALACYCASWRKVGALGKPAWLAELHPMDRHLAERWLAEVGEARFRAIAAAATAARRPNHRPTKDTAAIVQFAVLYWLARPGLNVHRAAAAAAREFCAVPRPGVPTVSSVQRIMSNELRKLPAGRMTRIAAEAERRGMPIRAEMLPPLVRHFALSRAMPLPTVRFPSSLFNKALDRIAKAQSEAMTRILPPPAKLATLKRIQHLLTALEGLIPDDTPASHVSAMFADMVTALQRPQE